MGERRDGFFGLGVSLGTHDHTLIFRDSENYLPGLQGSAHL